MLRIVAVGRLKNASIKEACSEYATRIHRYGKLEITEVRDGGKRDAQAVQARREEGKALLKALPQRSKVVALTRMGEEESSLRFAKRLERWQDQGVDVSFVIGGAHGLDDRVLEVADFRWSLSQLTLPHELARLTLLEQIFRAFTILRGEPYHKGR